MSKYTIGLDYGSDSARALVVDVETGRCLVSSVKEYPRWKKGLYCDPKANQWRQHPKDYIDVLEYIVTDALSKCDADVAPNVIGMAFDTTGSTPALVAENGQPLAMLPEYSENPDACSSFGRTIRPWKRRLKSMRHAGIPLWIIQSMKVDHIHLSGFGPRLCIA